MKKNISHKSATSNQEIIDSCDFLSNAGGMTSTLARATGPWREPTFMTQDIPR
mgnify:CR=1 FL=1